MTVVAEYQGKPDLDMYADIFIQPEKNMDLSLGC
jgi:hypothetical protein